MAFLHLAGWLLLLLSLAGTGYTVHATIAVHRFRRTPPPPPVPAAAVSLLKPLHGAEPQLLDDLASFLATSHAAPVQMVCGLQRPDDAAVAVVARLRDRRPDARIDLVVNPTRHGANAKVSNLLNMAPTIRHPVVILSDADIAVPADYLPGVIAALAQPGTGAVTCLYRGRGDAGFWSVLAAAAISYHFLPSVLVARAVGRHQPCLGSTIALTGETLAAAGGFAALADILADDAALGRHVQALGLDVALARPIVDHGCVETSLAALWRHELRWAATVRGVDPRGYAGLVLTYPLATALCALPLLPAAALAGAAAALVARLALVRAVDRLTGAPSASPALLPLRDLLSFAVFLAGFATRSVDWQGARLRMGEHGRIAAAPESRS